MTADVNQLSAAAVLEAVRLQAERPEFTLSNGVVLRTKAVSREAVRRAYAGVPLPTVPRVFIEAKGREEPNPNHPDYLATLERAHEARLAAVRRCLLALGIDVVSVPDGFQRPEDDGWLDDLGAAGVEVHSEPPAMRRLDWLEMHALSSTMDAALTFARVAATYGLFEQEVRDSVDFFRVVAERRAAERGAAPQAVE